MSRSRLAVMVFILSITIIILFWSLLPSRFRINESSDFVGFYEPVAKRILAGQGITTSHTSLAVRYPPGYPIILSIVFGMAEAVGIREEFVLSAFILSCTGISTVLVFLLTTSVMDTKSGLLAAGIWMTYPFMLWLTKQPNSEIPFVVFFYTSVCLFWRSVSREKYHWFYYLAVGVSAGFSALIRPAAIGVIGIFILLLLLKRDIHFSLRSTLSVAILLGYLLIILPWEIWVYAKTGRIILLSTAGIPAILDGLTYAVDGEWHGWAAYIPDDAWELMGDTLVRAENGGMDTVTEIVFFLSEEARNRPFALLQLLGLKAVRSWYGTESGRLESVNLLLQIPYLFLITWGAVELWKKGGSYRIYLIFVASLAAYFWLMTTSALSILRYMMPVIGLLFTFAPAGLFRIKAIDRVFGYLVNERRKAVV